MKPASLLRITSVISLLFAVLHTVGGADSPSPNSALRRPWRRNLMRRECVTISHAAPAGELESVRHLT
jgi:hypothetical protein